MIRTEHDLAQDTAEWHEFRKTHYGASEASAMLGVSPYKKRNQLIKEKATGLKEEVSAYTKKIFAKGHEVEELARKIIENEIGEDLFAITYSLGNLSASTDGITMDETKVWECKQYNESLYKLIGNGELPEHHWPQVQQALLVTGADVLYFTCSDGTPERTVTMEVYPDKDYQQRLIDGWKQFEIDVANYQPEDVKEQAIAEAVMSLPILSVQIKGEIALSNMPTFKDAADKYLAEIKTDLTTDQDFANAESQAKDCREAAKTLELAKKAALSQTADIDELMRTIDLYKDRFNKAGLALEKAVKEKKEAIKVKIIHDAKIAYSTHLASLNSEISPFRVILSDPDFAGAMKNKRTLSSLQDAVDAELSSAKINSNSVAKDIRDKLAWYSQHKEYSTLFADLQSIIQKPIDDFKLTVETRITEHKKLEAERLEKQIAEQAKIEAEKLERQRLERARLEAEIEANKPKKVENTINTVDVNSQGKVNVENQVNLTQTEEPKQTSVRRLPTKQELIHVIAINYNIDDKLAEEWLMAEFDNSYIKSTARLMRDERL